MVGLKWTLLALPLLLGGCFVPLPITLASLSLSGAAYLDTGKTMPELALSAATAQDCSLFRALSGGGPVCQGGAQDDAIMLAGGPEDAAPTPSISGEALMYPGCGQEQQPGRAASAWSQCVGLDR